MTEIMSSILPFIFLDIDGVINPLRNYKIRHDLGLPTRNDKIEFPNCTMASLKRIIDETGGFIVLSSTWRFGWDTYMTGLNPVQDNLLAQISNYDIFISDTTPIRRDRNRGLEINQWLEGYVDVNIKIKSIDQIPYIILDDDPHDILPYHSDDRVVITDSIYGLTPMKADEVINKLNDQQQRIKLQ